MNPPTSDTYEEATVTHATTDTTPTAFDSSDEDQDYTCPHCDRTFTSHIGLVGHLRIHRTDTGKPVPEAPTYTHHTRIQCPHCSRTFRHRIGLFDHMRIQESGPDRTPDTPTTSNTSAVHTPTLAPSVGATTTTTITPPEISTHTPHAPNCHLPRKWEVCISTRSPCGFGCTGDLSPRLSRHVKRRG
nr:unnamed protein product [Spirometra erinaceieuropaei]